MILESLVSYYEKLAEQGKISVPGWSRAKVSYALDLRDDGSLRGVMPLKWTVERGKKTLEVPSELIVPEMVTRSSGILSNFLCDNSKYMLGIEQTGANERSVKCFEAAREKHLSILETANSTCANAIKLFFETWNPEETKECEELQGMWDDITTNSNLIFYVDGVYAHEDEGIRQAWELFRQKSDSGVRGRCLVTGERAEIARIHTPIKGVPGAQSSGAALVSFNAPSFESYGKEQSYNAPVGTYAMYAYSTALNYLISNRDYAIQLGDTTVVFWSEDAKPETQNLFLRASEPVKDNQDILKGVFGHLAAGKAADTESVIKDINLEQRFYILGLSPNAARLSVRFFYVDQFGNILRHLSEHYERMRVVRPSYDDLEYLGIWRMLQETVNKKSKEKKPSAGMAGRVMEAVLSGGRYPESLYFAVLGRIRAEQEDADAHIHKITRGRAAIIKAYLLRNHPELKMEGEDFVGLNKQCNDVAYVLGREFAVLEEIQEAASGQVNATIKDRYFNSACATPVLVFPMLFKLANSHIRKIKETGRSISFEKALTELQGKIPEEGYPKRLNLQEQGQFIVGYYHQVQQRYMKKEEK